MCIRDRSWRTRLPARAIDVWQELEVQDLSSTSDWMREKVDAVGPAGPGSPPPPPPPQAPSTRARRDTGRSGNRVGDILRRVTSRNACLTSLEWPVRLASAPDVRRKCRARWSILAPGDVPFASSDVQTAHGRSLVRCGPPRRSGERERMQLQRSELGSLKIAGARAGSVARPSRTRRASLASRSNRRPASSTFAGGARRSQTRPRRSSNSKP